MANLVRKIETTLSFGLVLGAALAFTIWHEPGCRTLLTHFAGVLRQPLIVSRAGKIGVQWSRF